MAIIFNRAELDCTMKKIILERTEVIAKLHNTVVELEANLGKVLRQFWWEKRVPIREKTTYLIALAEARTNLFSEINRKYPETRGAYLFGVDTSCVYYECKDDNEKAHPSTT